MPEKLPSPDEAEALYSMKSYQLEITQTELSGKLRTAVENAALKSAGSMEALRLAVSDFTVALRDEGTTPEAVLINLKAVINAHAFPALAPATSRGRSLRATISTWCIEEYFKQRTA